MAINVPIDVDVSGLPALEALDDNLDDVAKPRRVDLDFDTSAIMAEVTAVDAAMDAATETREADIDIEVSGMGNLERLRESLDLARERREVAALEEALEDVAKLRRAGVDVEGTEEGIAKLSSLEKALKAVERRRTVEIDIDSDAATSAAIRGGNAISEAFSGAFQLVAKNAIVLTGAVALAFAAFPVIGAVAATGLVLGFGGAIAGIGILAAAQSEKVKKAFGEMADTIVKDMKEIAAPLEGTLISIADDITSTFRVFKPALEQAFSDLDPVLTRFSDSFFKAFENLEPAIAPLTEAFSELLDSIGPRLDGFFTNLSDSIIQLSDVISADPELFASLFVGLMEVIPFVITLVADLASTFVIISDVVSTQLGPAISEFMDALGPISKAFSDATGGLSIFRVGLGVTVAAVFGIVTAISAALRVTTVIIRGFRAAGKAIADTWRNTRIVTINVWNAIRAAVSRAVGAVRGAVSAGMAAVRGVVSSVMARIRGVFSSAWAAIRGVVAGGVSRVRGAVSNLSAIVGTVMGVWSRVRGAFSRGISSAVSLVRGLPGRVAGAMGNLGSTLYSAGVSLIGGFARGIRAAIGDAVSAASSAVSAVRDFFPFSPAKKGPFSGTGYTTYSGKALTEDFAKSISDTAKQVAPSLDPFADAFKVPTLGVSGSSSPLPANTAAAGSNSDLVAALASLFTRMKFDITLGLDRRTTATLWLDGQKMAEVLQ